MKVINSPKKIPSHFQMIFVISVLITQSFARIKTSDFGYSDFDLNDEFENSPVLKMTKHKHLQENDPVIVQTSNTTTDVIKNEDTLPTDLFVTPDISLNETHPPEESEGYLQVLQAMKIKPLTSKTVQAKTGLNDALLKVLTITQTYTTDAKSALTSSSLTVNDLAQYYSSILFGRRYIDQNGTVVEADNITIPAYQNFVNNATKYVIPNEESENAVSSRLLTLVRMYKEHVEHKDKEIIADEGHYGHLKHFSENLKCIADSDCDFGRHLLSISSNGLPQRHLLEKHMSENTKFIPELGNKHHADIATLLEVVGSTASDSEIKASTQNFISNAQASLNNFESNDWPNTNAGIQSALSGIQTSLPYFQQITPDQFLSVLDTLSNTYKAKVDKEFNANGLSDKAKALVNERNSINELHNALKQALPIPGVLEADFQRLDDKLAYQIGVFNNAGNATPLQIQNAQIKLKNEIQKNINGVDPVKNAELVQAIANNTDAILKSDFGKSLNKENLDFIIHKAVGALHVDFDQMNDNQKASGFFLDHSDLETLTNDVVNELKKGRENNQQFVVNLVDLHKRIQNLNQIHNAQPNSGDPANDAADILISYDDQIYNALGSDDFYAGLRDYVSKYYAVYRAHVDELAPFIDYSSSFKVLTNGLNNPNALGVANPVAARVLYKTSNRQLKSIYDLSEQDKAFFKVINHLVAEWAMTTDVQPFIRKLNKIIDAVQGKIVGSIELMSIPERELQFAFLDQAKNAVSQLIGNFGTGANAAQGLSETIAHGQGLASNVANLFQVNSINSNSTAPSSGFLGSIKNKFLSWFGRKLEVHYGILDTIESVKNLSKQISDAKNTADNLKKTFQQGKEFSDTASSIVHSLTG